MDSMDLSDQPDRERPRADGEPTSARSIAPNTTDPTPSPSKPIQLFDIFTDYETYYPIFKIMKSIMPVRDFVALRRTCKAVRPMYKHLQESQWNINLKLRRFFKDPTGFRSELGEINALISGSFALQFFDGVLWLESDLDIFVEDGPGVKKMQDYLCKKEGYTHESTKERVNLHEYILSSIYEIHTYTREDRGSDSYRKIQIVTTDCIPLKAIIGGFYTTALVNIITWNKAYSIFPHPTFLHYKTYPLLMEDEYHKPLHTKMNARGWQMQTKLWAGDREDDGEEEARIWNCWMGKNPYGRLGRKYWWRRVGDNRSWIIQFPVENVRIPAMPDSVIEYSEFNVQPREGSHPFYYISPPFFHSPVLRYTYTYGLVLTELGEKLADLTRSSLRRLRPDERPEGQQYEDNRMESGYLSLQFPPEYQVPERWTYFDQDIPDWYASAERKMLGEMDAEGQLPVRDRNYDMDSDYEVDVSE